MSDQPDAPTQALVRLAEAYAVSTEYWSHAGTLQRCSTSTLVGVLAALGVDASTPERVEVALAHRVNDEWRRTLPPVVVQRSGEHVQVPVHVTDGDPVTCVVELEAEAGVVALAQADVFVEPRRVDGRLVGRATFDVPVDLPLGWHELVADVPGGQVRTTLVVVPHHLELPAGLASRRGWGLMAQLYSVRSSRSWGIGDLADLAEMADLFGRLGGDFVLVNPLHAAEPVAPMTPSPYLPTTRRFVNPVYIRVEEVPEAGYLTSAERALVDWAGEPARVLDTDPRAVDRDVAWAAKRAALEVVFTVPRPPSRQRAFEGFVAQEGSGLATFALWCAIAEKYAGAPWPEQARDPGSPLVARLRGELADRVEFYAWLQWVADEQLAHAQHLAREAGMALGIMHDLAVGVHPDGADVWALGHVLTRGATVGAPPDMYNQQGQDWSQPPWHPDALAREAYRPYRDMLRTVLRHAGALRIDHVIGLFRLWWIPTGHGADQGAYVRYDHEALVGILMLEAARAGAVVVGEDLGTVEPWVRDFLAERGILGTAVLWFEHEGDRPRPPEHWRRQQLATVTTHDLPPTAGYLAGEHVTLRDRLGLLAEPVAVVRARAAREREAMLTALRDRGLLGADPSEREVVEAMHRYVLATPAALVGVALVDAVGERRAQNQPGTDREYPNWKVPLGDSSGTVVLIDDLEGNARLQSLVAVLQAE